MNEKDKVIDPKKFYTLGEIVREGLLPGINTVMKAARLMQSDAMTNKIFNARIVPRGSFGSQYKVKGENIIRYLVSKEQ